MPEDHPGKCRRAGSLDKKRIRDASLRLGMVMDRQEWIDAYKMSVRCESCGYGEDPVALDFDHRDRADKKANVSSLLRYARWEDVLAEIAKCRVLCSNCHRVKTMREDKGRRH